MPIAAFSGTGFDEISKHYSWGGAAPDNAWDIAYENKKLKYGVGDEKLNAYRAGHPKFNFPEDLEYLVPAQSRQILKYYWENYRFNDLIHTEIRDYIWDIFIANDMKRAEKITNDCINKYYKTKIKFDSPFGSIATIDKLNGIKPENMPKFISVCKN